MFGLTTTHILIGAAALAAFILLNKPQRRAGALTGSWIDGLERDARSRAANIVVERYGSRKARELADGIASGIADPKA